MKRRWIVSEPQKGEIITSLLLIGAGIMVLGTLLGVTQVDTNRKLTRNTSARTLPILTPILDLTPELQPTTQTLPLSPSPQTSVIPTPSVNSTSPTPTTSLTPTVGISVTPRPCSYSARIEVRDEQGRPLNVTGAQGGLSLRTILMDGSNTQYGQDEYFTAGVISKNNQPISANIQNLSVKKVLQIADPSRYQVVSNYCTEDPLPLPGGYNNMCSLNVGEGNEYYLTMRCDKTVSYGWVVRGVTVNTNACLMDSTASVKDENGAVLPVSGQASGFSVRHRFTTTNSEGQDYEGQTYFDNGRILKLNNPVAPQFQNTPVTLDLTYDQNLFELVRPYCTEQTRDSGNNYNQNENSCGSLNGQSQQQVLRCNKNVDYGWVLRRKPCAFDSTVYVKDEQGNPLTIANGPNSGFKVHWSTDLGNGNARSGDTYFENGRNNFQTNIVAYQQLGKDINLTLTYPEDRYELVNPYCNQNPAEGNNQSPSSVCVRWSGATVVGRQACGKTMEYGWILRRKSMTAELRLDEANETRRFYNCWSAVNTEGRHTSGGNQGGSVQRGDNNIRCRSGYDAATDTLRVELQLKNSGLAPMRLTLNPNRCVGIQERCENTRAMDEIFLQGITLEEGASSDGSGGDKAICYWRNLFNSTSRADITCTNRGGEDVPLPTQIPPSSLRGTLSTFSISLNGQTKQYTFSPGNQCTTASRTDGAAIPGLRIQPTRNTNGEVTQVQIHLENADGVGNLQVGFDDGCACWAGASGVGICSQDRNPTATRALFNGCFGDDIGKLTCTSAGCSRSGQGALGIHCNAPRGGDTTSPTPVAASQVCRAEGALCQEDYPENCGNGGSRLCHKRNGVCSGVGNGTLCSWGPGSYCEACSDGSIPMMTPVPTNTPGARPTNAPGQEGHLACSMACEYSEGEGSTARCYTGRCRLDQADCGFNVNCEYAAPQCGITSFREVSCRPGALQVTNRTRGNTVIRVCPKDNSTSCITRTLNSGRYTFFNLDPDDYTVSGSAVSQGVVGMVMRFFGFGTTAAPDDIEIVGDDCRRTSNNPDCDLTVNPAARQEVEARKQGETPVGQSCGKCCMFSENGVMKQGSCLDGSQNCSDNNNCGYVAGCSEYAGATVACGTTPTPPPAGSLGHNFNVGDQVCAQDFEYLHVSQSCGALGLIQRFERAVIIAAPANISCSSHPSGRRDGEWYRVQMTSGRLQGNTGYFPKELLISAQACDQAEQDRRNAGLPNNCPIMPGGPNDYCTPAWIKEHFVSPNCPGCSEPIDNLTAYKFSAICMRESGGNPRKIWRACLREGLVGYAVGLFQYNLFAHRQELFSNPGRLPCIVKNENEMRQAEEWYMNPFNAAQAARELYARSGMGAWRNTENPAACSVQ